MELPAFNGVVPTKFHRQDVGGGDGNGVGEGKMQLFVSGL
jgi:hypothetical protein